LLITKLGFGLITLLTVFRQLESGLSSTFSWLYVHCLSCVCYLWYRNSQNFTVGCSKFGPIFS